MTFRNLKVKQSNVVLQANPCSNTTGHEKAQALPVKRLRELGGIHPDQLADYNGQECIFVVDTETTCENGDNFGKPLIYDIGITIVIKSTGEPVAKASFIITDVFCDYKLMKSAFFTNRVFTDYPYILNMQLTNLVNYKTALDMIEALEVQYNVNTFGAYNSDFDTRAFLATADYLEAKTDEFYNYGLVSQIRDNKIDVLDLWALSCMTFMSSDAYKEQAFNHSWYTKGGKWATNAECANNFINGYEMGEDHCALSDSAIEAGIYKYCLDTQPDFNEVVNICLRGKGETWSYVNNQGNDSVLNWVSVNHPEKLAEFKRLAKFKRLAIAENSCFR